MRGEDVRRAAERLKTIGCLSGSALRTSKVVKRMGALAYTKRWSAEENRWDVGGLKGS
jgi:hypothetical protein